MRTKIKAAQAKISKTNSSLTPKTRAEKALIKILENAGNVSAALREAGYKEGYAKNPQDFKKTKAYKTMAEALLHTLPRYEIAKRHVALLNAEQLRPINFDFKMKDAEVIKAFTEKGYRVMNIKRSMNTATAFVFVPENDIRKGALDLIYKVLGDYAAEKLEVLDPLRMMSDEELMRRKKDLIAKLRKKSISV